jgi:hypothetical protein
MAPDLAFSVAHFFSFSLFRFDTPWDSGHVIAISFLFQLEQARFFFVSASFIVS